MRLERVFDSRLFKTLESITFRAPETVGTIRVAEVVVDETRYPGFSTIKLGFPKEVEEESWRIYRVPPDWIEQGEITEVLVRRQQGLSTVADSVFKLSETWLVAVRRFQPVHFVTPISVEDQALCEMFHANLKTQNSAPAFYERFIEDRRPKLPPFVRF